MIDKLRLKFQHLLQQKTYKAVLFEAVIYLGIAFFAIMSVITLFMGHYDYMIIKIIVFCLLIGILHFYQKTSHIKLSALFLIITIDIEIGIAILSDQIFLLPTLYPFIAIAGFFFFFNFKEAVIATLIHYLYWLIIFYIGHTVTHPEHPFFSLTYIFNIFITSFFILTFSMAYYFSTKSTYDEIQTILSENRSLLREIYHRINNNLNFIASILGLQIHQAQKTPPVSYQDHLTNARLKIETMVTVHEILYNTDNLNEIQLQAYLENLTALILKIYGTPLQIDIDTKHFTFDLNTTNRIGIIINELVTNSIKHHSTQHIPHIHISLHKKEHLYSLCYHQSEEQFIDLQNLENSTSLGMRLIKMIVEEQLKGELQIVWENGLRIKILFA
ncbi:MAG: hypothetical protein K0U47_03825 [Epsilonproteobacteria bacterium]|nr:hypothetical protein [Campylobacterota bacterium]